MAREGGGVSLRRLNAAPLCFCLVLAVGLSDTDPLKNHPRTFPAGLRTGDVVFRMGRGMFSSFFSRMGSRPIPYSHVGIYVEQEGVGYVVHTEANELTGEGWARTEPLETFLGPKRAVSGAVFRPVGITEEQRNAIAAGALVYAKLRVPFDTDFDLATVDRIYCTELVWRAFVSAGIDISPVLDTIGDVPIAGGRRRSIVSLNNLVEGGRLSFLAQIN